MGNILLIRIIQVMSKRNSENTKNNVHGCYHHLSGELHQKPYPIDLLRATFRAVGNLSQQIKAIPARNISEI